eukprot:195474-Prymnesium_polylepis.2
MGGAVGARLDGFRSRALKGAAPGQQTRHLYAIEWWRQPGEHALQDSCLPGLTLLGVIRTEGRARAAGADREDGSIVPSTSIGRHASRPSRVVLSTASLGGLDGPGALPVVESMLCVLSGALQEAETPHTPA